MHTNENDMTMESETQLAHTRWSNYRLANTERPEAREIELRTIFTLLNATIGEKVWEVGTGNGYLTLPLAKAVAPSGKVVTTDVTEGNIEEVTRLAKEHSLPIHALLLPVASPLLDVSYAGKFDAVTSIATLHHFDNRKEKTGEKGRIGALQAFYDALAPGGRVVVADPLDDTVTQRYFDAIDTPFYCAPDGHPHDFFTLARLREVVEDIGFKNVRIDVIRVPWKFSSENDAAGFVHTIHNAEASAIESFSLAKEILGFEKIENHFELGWDLFFLTGTK